MTITLSYVDGRRGQMVADAHPDNQLVKQIEASGTQKARRGRRPTQS